MHLYLCLSSLCLASVTFSSASSFPGASSKASEAATRLVLTPCSLSIFCFSLLSPKNPHKSLEMLPLRPPR